MKAKADLKPNVILVFSITGTRKDEYERQDEAEAPRVDSGGEGRPPHPAGGARRDPGTGRTRVNEEDETSSKGHVKRNRIGNLNRPGVE